MATLTLGSRSARSANQGKEPSVSAPTLRQASPSSAPDSGPPTREPTIGSSDANLPGQSSAPELFLRMMVALAVVIGLGAAALYLSKRVLPRVARVSAKKIHIVETVYLGPRKALHLVEVGGHRLLIGSTHENITPLATIGEAWLDVSKPAADTLVDI